MAYLEDYRPEDERLTQQESVGPGQSFTPSAPAGPASAQSETASSSGPSGTGFQPLTTYFASNEGAGQDMAKGLADDVWNKGKDAVASWDQGKASDARSRADALGSQEGIAQGLQDRYSDPLYNSGMAGLDAYLATRGSTGQFDNVKNQFGGLDWNVVGTQLPEKPTQRDIGEEPGLLGITEKGPLGGERYDVPKVWNHGRYEQYKRTKPKYDAWRQSAKDAIAEYDQAGEEYGKQFGEWSKLANPFYTTFGLDAPTQPELPEYELRWNPKNDVVPNHRKL